MLKQKKEKPNRKSKSLETSKVKKVLLNDEDLEQEAVYSEGEEVNLVEATENEIHEINQVL